MAQDQSNTATVAVIHPRGSAEATAPANSPTAPQPSPAALQPASNAPTAAASTAAAPKPKGGGLRRLILLIIIVAALSYAGNMGYQYFVSGRFIVTTDDAYVGASTAIISAKATGHIVEVAVANNQSVKAGDLLVRIDPGDYQLAVDAAKDKIVSQDAVIARVARQAESQLAVIAGAEAQVGAARAALSGAEAEVQRAALEFDRSQKMAETNVGSLQRLEQATADKARTASSLLTARANVSVSEAALASAKGNLDVLKAQEVEATATRSELQTALAKAEHDMTFTEVRAPFDGVIGNKAVELGQYAMAGTRLFALVNPAKTYVDANFKETQLEGIKVGQKVDIAMDSRGGAVIQGVVESIAPATGAQFSLLPPDNATGNFTKVVQRAAVRIALAVEDVKANRLIPGLSVIASVHTRDESLPAPTIVGFIKDTFGIDLAKSSRSGK